MLRQATAHRRRLAHNTAAAMAATATSAACAIAAPSSSIAASAGVGAVACFSSCTSAARAAAASVTPASARLRSRAAAAHSHRLPLSLSPRLSSAITRAFSSSSFTTAHTTTKPSATSAADEAAAAAAAATAARDAIPDAEYTGGDEPQAADTPQDQSQTQSADTATVVESATGASDTRGGRRTPKRGDGSAPPVVAAWGGGHLGCIGRQSYEPAPLPVPVYFPPPIDSLASSDPDAPPPPEPVPAAIAANWGRNVMISQRGSIYEWGWHAPFRMLLKVAGWARESPWLLLRIQRLRKGLMSMCGADPLGAQRMPGWGHEVGEGPLAPEEERLYAVAGACGSDYSAVLSSQGQVYTWGANFYGQTGHSSHLRDGWIRDGPRLIAHYQNQHPNESLARQIETGNHPIPPSFPETPLVQVACGFAHTLLLTRGGQVYACGKSDTGALGITHIYRDSKRVFLPHLIPVTDAFWAGEQGAGESHMRQQAWDSGEHAITPFEQAQNDPNIVDAYIGPVEKVAAGMKFSLILTARGELFGAGASGLNELGDGRYHPMAGLVPIRVPLLSPRPRRSQRWRRNREAQAAGLQPSDAADEWETTSDDFFSASTSAATPTERLITVAAGLHHSLALSNLGHVYAWGLNQQGQCTGHPPRAGDDGSSFWQRWSRRLSHKRAAPTLQHTRAEAEAAGIKVSPEDGAVAPYVRASPENLAAVNTARRAQVAHMCCNPIRVKIEHLLAPLGVSLEEFGQVVSISAGFYDSALISDRGYCLTMGGALSPDGGAQGPSLARVTQPSAVPVPAAARARAHPWPQGEHEPAVAQVAFGLSHAIAIVKPKPAHLRTRTHAQTHSQAQQ